MPNDILPPPPGPPPALPGWAAEGPSATMPDLRIDQSRYQRPVEPAEPEPAEPKPNEDKPRLPGLPLTIIATVQIVLSVRLIRSNSAFSDEALYLWAGRLEWSGWLHHTAVPPLATYFSGAPVIYPPLGALANAVGGLTGARVLSLLFMLGATVLLHGLTRRIFDRRSANFAAALFVGLGSAQFLGTFATYDAMAVFLLALATWLGVRSAGLESAGFRRTMIMLAALALVVADAAKYATALFDPVVLLVIASFGWHARGRRAGLSAGSIAVVSTAAGLGAALALGGSPYWTGVTSTTLSRTHSNWPAFGVLYASAGWVGVVVILAVFGAVATSYASRSAPAKVLAWTLVAAGLLAPAEQARIHVFTSLFKHIAFGAWFAAPVAGYALTAFIRAIPAAKATSALRVSTAVLALSGLLGVVLAADHFGNWADTAKVLPALRAALRTHPGQLLVDDGPTFDYYLQDAEPWPDITSIAVSSPSALEQAVRHRRFSVILFSYAVGGGGCGNADPQLKSSRAQCLHYQDLKVLNAILSDGGYRLVKRIRYKTTSFSSAYQIWARQPGDRSGRQ
ncbi:MAG TPA: hypothetical protein VFI65_22260 [Streptosporangiaceae bacterium]|nr:hypothetical protein [Streptosporangiaceae bacterium]